MEFMKSAFKFFSAAVAALVILSANSSALASPKKSEAELIQMLFSGDYHKMNDALDRLPNWYPNSTNAVQIIRGMLRSNEVATISRQRLSQKSTAHEGDPILIPMPSNTVARMAARALGNYHAALDEDELNIICQFLKSHDVETVMDGLKALRGLDAPQTVPQILPLLKDENAHVVRDACRTLAVLGNASTIPYIEELLKHLRPMSPDYGDMKKDAQNAIKALRAKS